MKLADCANDDGVCWPSLRTIAAETELSRDTVIRGIRLLKSTGLVTVIRRNNGRSSISNKYLLLYNGEGSAEAAVRAAQRQMVKAVIARSDHAQLNKRKFLLAQSHHPSSIVGSEVVADSDTNHHIEPSIEPFSLSKKALEQGDLIQHGEAKRLFGQLSLDVFSKDLRENQWSSKMEHKLDEFLPLKREDWALIEWFYRLPDDHEIFMITYRRQSVEALIENLSREVQKIRSTRRRIRLKSLYPAEDEAASAREAMTEWTPERREAWETMFPNTDPGPFYLLGHDLQRQVDENVRLTQETTKKGKC